MLPVCFPDPSSDFITYDGFFKKFFGYRDQDLMVWGLLRCIGLIDQDQGKKLLTRSVLEKQVDSCFFLKVFALIESLGTKIRIEPHRTGE